MFGIFKQKQKPSIQEILEQLGQSASNIIDVAKKSSDLEVAMYGSAAVMSIIQSADEVFGIRVHPGIIFSSYLYALQQKDMAKMAEMTKEMANALSQVDTNLHRGALVHFWFNGQS